ncbi:ATP-binding protein [Streptomyces sp. AC550_RSS872]|uniref:ATP-binding protein n=1 Tax=Streptomyces sp. AC550_RSS872 TaxID=2823689 RepID=UPI001C274547|nr:ATP-binding protein [Streptomyces sp. AC550_RSS872]
MLRAYHLFTTATALRVEISDPRGERLPCAPDATSDDQFGRGLALAEALADDWGITPRTVGKTVYAEWLLTRGLVLVRGAEQ